jgi:hypothetical protein
MYITYAALYKFILLLSVKLMLPALSPHQSPDAAYCTLFQSSVFLMFYCPSYSATDSVPTSTDHVHNGITLSGAVQEDTTPMSQAAHWLS